MRVNADGALRGCVRSGAVAALSVSLCMGAAGVASASTVPEPTPSDGFATGVALPAALPVEKVGAARLGTLSVQASADGFRAVASQKDRAKFSMGTTSPSRPTVLYRVLYAKREYTTVARAGSRVPAGKARYVTYVQRQKEFFVGDTSGRAGKVTVSATLGVGKRAATFVARNARYPKGGQIVVQYGKWNKLTGKPRMGVDVNGDGVIDKGLKVRKADRR